MAEIAEFVLYPEVAPSFADAESSAAAHSLHGRADGGGVQEPAKRNGANFSDGEINAKKSGIKP
jgi:hypothetical protein